MTGRRTGTPSVLIAGSTNTDLVLRTRRFPKPGESLIGGSYCRMAGGKGANQAVAIARLGAASTFVGKIGNDAEGLSLKSSMAAEGVCTEFLTPAANSQTGLAVVTVTEAGENAIVVVPGANRELTIEDVGAALSRASYDALMLQFEISPETIIGACRLATRQDLPIVVDAGPAQCFALEELEGIHILTPNETETATLSGIEPINIPEAQRAARFLLHRSHARAVVLKLGERGALLCSGDGQCEYFPAFGIDAIDTTAAGDAFTAAMTMTYVKTRDLRHAVMRGNAAGALASKCLGAQASLPTECALEQFLSEQEAYAG